MKFRMINVLFVCAASLYCVNANAVRVDFSAELGTDVAVGYFEWFSSDSIFAEISDGMGNGKILWEISGAIQLNGATLLPMTDVKLEVMDNWFIDAQPPDSLIGDQITLFGTAASVSGLRSVQNFYFRDESGLLFNSIQQPTTQIDFDQFTDIRVDLLLFGVSSVQTFSLTQWKVTSPVPVPGAIWLFGSGLLGLIGVVKCNTDVYL